MISIKAENDKEFEIKELESVTPHTDGEGWTFDFVEGFTFWMDKPYDDFPAPKAGDLMKLWGKGIGYQVRGLMLINETGGHLAYYKTAEELQEENKKQVEESNECKRLEFEKEAYSLALRVAKLPAIFQQRINKFVHRKGYDWRWKFLSYELFCCEQAVLIAEKLKTPEEVEKFNKLTFKEQKELIPEIADGHSGNTFGAAVSYAYWLLKDQKVLFNAHGAIAGLVGCEEYGCHVKS
jgi:hypothetical protein